MSITLVSDLSITQILHEKWTLSAHGLFYVRVSLMAIDHSLLFVQTQSVQPGNI
jgi:hypothetical protein